MSKILWNSFTIYVLLKKCIVWLIDPRKAVNCSFVNVKTQLTEMINNECCIWLNTRSQFAVQKQQDPYFPLFIASGSTETEWKGLKRCYIFQRKNAYCLSSY